MRETKISIVVPVYNAEKELQRCVDSIFRQSFSIEKDGAIPGESLIIPCSVSSTEGRNNYTPKPLFGEEALP